MTSHRMVPADAGAQNPIAGIVGQRFHLTEHFTLGHSDSVFQEEGRDSSAMYRSSAVV